MSLNRVSSLESLNATPTSLGANRRRDSTTSIRSTKLTFNPLPSVTTPQEREDDGGHHHHHHHHHPSIPTMHTVPLWKRLAQVGGTILYCLLGAGVIFGFAALKPVLKMEGAYRAVCAQSLSSSPSPLSPAPPFLILFRTGGGDGSGNGAGNGEGENPNDPLETCIDIHLNLIFTLSAVATNVAALPVGTLLDVFGPRICALVGATFLTLGSVILAHALNITAFDALLWGYLFLALGGPAVFISAFHLSNAFPARSGLVLALLTGAFDASSAVFLGYRVLYERTGGGVGLKQFFLGYLVVPISVAAMNIGLLPGRSYQGAGEMVCEGGGKMVGDGEEEREDTTTGGEPDERTALLRGDTLVASSSGSSSADGDMENAVEVLDAKLDHQKRRNERSGVAGVLHGRSTWRQICTPWFTLICLFTVIQMLRLNFFISTIRTQYTYLLSSPLAARSLNHVFDAALPLGGILAIPFIGHLLDSFSAVISLSVLVALPFLTGLLGLVPHSMVAGLANICLFVIYRPFFYTAVSDYAGKVFGFATFGTVYGSLISLAGLGNFVQSALDVVFQKTCRGDPFVVNAGLLMAGAVAGLGLVGFVWWAVRRRDMEEGMSRREGGRA